jgi:hypothetical protein
MFLSVENLHIRDADGLEVLFEVGQSVPNRKPSQAGRRVSVALLVDNSLILQRMDNAYLDIFLYRSHKSH